MKFLALIAGAFALASISAVSAAECANDFDQIVDALQHVGAPPFIIEPADLPDMVDAAEAITGHELGEATRGFLGVSDGKVLLGLEVDGCLLDPIVVGTASKVIHQLSGKDKVTGDIGA